MIRVIKCEMEEFKMSKLGKKLMAMGVAAVTAVSMGISASASTWQNYNLHWAKGAPTSDIETYTEIGDNGNNKVFTIGTYKKIKMQDNITSFNANSLVSEGYVYDYTIGTWGFAITRTYSSTGLKPLASATYTNAYIGNAAQIRLTLNYSTSGYTAGSSGKVIAK